MMDSLTGDQFRLDIQDGSVTVVDALPPRPTVGGPSPRRR